jgi:hypothetical protein
VHGPAAAVLGVLEAELELVAHVDGGALGLGHQLVGDLRRELDAEVQQRLLADG